MATATRPGRVSPALAARVMAAKPAWRIRARYGNGDLWGTIQAGLTSDPTEALALFRAKYAGRFTPPDHLRAFPVLP